jgi:hypothetical protein
MEIENGIWTNNSGNENWKGEIKCQIKVAMSLKVGRYKNCECENGKCLERGMERGNVFESTKKEKKDEYLLISKKLEIKPLYLPSLGP